jgi:hypothetical protein
MPIAINSSVTLDETIGLQTGGIASGGDDNNDSDVLLSQLQSQVASFYNRLFTAGGLNLDPAFATANGVARSADGMITVTGSGTVTSLGFFATGGAALSVYAGNPLLGAATNLSALDGGAIRLFADAVLGNRVAHGYDEDGDLVFSLFLDPVAALTSARLWMVQFEALANTNPNNPDDPLELTGLGVGAGQSTEFNFAGLPSGQNLFGMVGDAATGLIVIGKVPVLNADGTFTNASNTINTSKGGGQTTIGVNNQMFDPGEGAYFTFVKNPNTNFLGTSLDANEADDADNMQYSGGTLEVTGAFVEIAQLQGGGLATMQIECFNIAGSPQGTALIGASGANPVTITAVRVFNELGQKIEDSALAGGQDPDVTINIAAGVATVSGLDSKYRVEWDTNGVHEQILITGVAGKFDIGGFGATQAAPTPDQKLDFVVTATDGDGDTATAGFSVGVDGTGIFDDGAVAGVALSAFVPLGSELTSQASLQMMAAAGQDLQLEVHVMV